MINNSHSDSILCEVPLLGSSRCDDDEAVTSAGGNCWFVRYTGGDVGDGWCCGAKGGLVFIRAGARSSSIPCANVHPRNEQLPLCSQFLQMVVLNFVGSVPMRFAAASFGSEKDDVKVKGGGIDEFSLLLWFL